MDIACHSRITYILVRLTTVMFYPNIFRRNLQSLLWLIPSAWTVFALADSLHPYRFASF